MKVVIPGYVVPVMSGSLEIGGKTVMLRPRDRWPIFAEGARELRGIEHMMGPLVVDYPAPPKRQPKQDGE